MKVRTRLTLFFTLVFLIVLFIMAFLFTFLSQWLLNKNLDEQQEFVSKNFMDMMIPRIGPERLNKMLQEGRLFPNREMNKQGPGLNMKYNPSNLFWIAVYNDDYQLMASSALAQRYPFNLTEKFTKKKNFNFVFYNVKNDSVMPSNNLKMAINRFAVSRIQYSRQTIYLVMSINVTDEMNYIIRLRQFVFLSLIILGVSVFFIGMAFSRFTLSPIARITRQLHGISPEDLGKRLAVVNEKDEIGELTMSINRLFDRIENAFNMEKQFISDVSHEFKTPLSVLRLNLETVLNSPLIKKMDDNELEKLGITLETTYSLDQLVKKLLNLSRLEQNRTNPHFIEFDLNQLITQIMEQLKIITEDKGLKFRYANWMGNPLIRADRDLLSIAVFNIIENAIKYTSEGAVIITTKAEDGCCLIIVEDTGCGINPDKISYIFDKFYQADTTRNKYLGYGIGLSIAKRIIDLHNGSISVESQPEIKTVFTVRIPENIEV